MHVSRSILIQWMNFESLHYRFSVFISEAVTKFEFMYISVRLYMYITTYYILCRYTANGLFPTSYVHPKAAWKTSLLAIKPIIVLVYIL